MIFDRDIVRRARKNEYFRQVLTTKEHSQLVLMSVNPGDDIGEESHDVDQILVFVGGKAKAIIGEETFTVKKNSLVIVPAGVVHNFISNGRKPLKLFTIYAPAEEPDGLIHRTKADAVAWEKEHHGS